MKGTNTFFFIPYSEVPKNKLATSANLTTMKCMICSTLSEPNAPCLLADVKNFYLNTPMKNPEFMHIPLNLILQEIIDEYKLLTLFHNGHVYIRINKGMYGLP